ncbi:MAG: hypothetical protein M1830_008436 [Pleopsidium flavum]|nr:MAG: hypothetical protein M1830_008436 [Pleopsidium flavum]
MATGTALLEGDPRSNSKSKAQQVVNEDEAGKEVQKQLESRLRRKVDLRLCTIAGILCSLNLLDSGIISSASVTSMLSDLSLDGNRYSVSIFIFTIASVIFQLPSTVAVRVFGPRIWFAFITFCFGLITMVGVRFEKQVKENVLTVNFSAQLSFNRGEK